jgi:hypothetical protein
VADLKQWDGLYREGAKGRCFWCGLKREEHKYKKPECPCYAEVKKLKRKAP